MIDVFKRSEWGRAPSIALSTFPTTVMKLCDCHHQLVHWSGVLCVMENTFHMKYTFCSLDFQKVLLQMNTMDIYVDEKDSFCLLYVLTVFMRFFSINSCFLIWDARSVFCWSLKMESLNMDSFCLLTSRLSEFQITFATCIFSGRAVCAYSYMGLMECNGFVWCRVWAQHVYWISAETGSTQQWSNKFLGEWQQSKLP